MQSGRAHRPRMRSCSADRGAFCLAAIAALADGVPPPAAAAPASGGALPARRCSRESAELAAADLRTWGTAGLWLATSHHTHRAGLCPGEHHSGTTTACRSLAGVHTGVCKRPQRSWELAHLAAVLVPGRTARMPSLAGLRSLR